MTTSGTATFNLEIDDLITEAYERCGIESRSGYDLTTARRSLNLLFADWANDASLPTLDECKRRAKIEGIVTHDALDDAWDVVQLLRTQY